MSLLEIEQTLESITMVATLIPGPQQALAAIALPIEKIFGAALKAHAATSGKTVEEIMAGWKPIAPVE